MSKLLVAFHRLPPEPQAASARMRRAIEEITPEPIRGTARLDVLCAEGQVLGTLDMPQAAPRAGLNLCQGRFFEPAPDWAVPRTPRPDGSYALVRADARHAELITDPAGGRTLWWYFDAEMLVASNSQRAVTLYVGRFEANPAVCPWVLSTGTPGPGLSYNRLLRMMPPDATLRLDRMAWTVSLDAQEPQFVPLPRSREDHLAALDAAVTKALGSFGDADAEQSILSLSGGADSRLIAVTLRRLGPDRAWRSFTSGSAEAAAAPVTDAAIGTAVAAALGIPHRLLAQQPGTEAPETILRRYVLCSEGRVDNFTGYTDGMRFLMDLRDAGVAVTIRGDVSMGSSSVAGDAFLMRAEVCLPLCSDIANLAPRLAEFGLEGQRYPDTFERQAGETIETWRDRLNRKFYVTHVLGALTEVKAYFGEIINPLLSRGILAVPLGLPEDLRTDKALYRDYVRGLGPDLPFARRNGGEGRRLFDFLFQPEIQAVLTASLSSPTCEALFGAPLARWLRRELARRMSPAHRLWRGVARRLGTAPQPGLRDVDPVRLAFRVHMAVAMTDQLTADAALLPRAVDVKERTAA